MEDNEIKEMFKQAMSMATTPVAGAGGLLASQRNLMGDIVRTGVSYGLGQQNIKKGMEESQASRDLTMRGQDFGLLGDKLKLAVGEKTVPGSQTMLEKMFQQKNTTIPTSARPSIWDDTSWNDFSTKFKSIFG
jgi:hypothetical protein